MGEKEIKWQDGRYKFNHINNYIKYKWDKLSNQEAEMTRLDKKQNPTLCSLCKLYLKYKDRMRK